MLLDAVIAVALSLLLYGWLIYPLLLRIIPARAARDDSAGTRTPSIAVVLSAHNEEKHLAARVRNLRKLDYPGDALVIYIGNDGSTDRTSEIARELAASDEKLVVVDNPERRGKIAVLKELVAAVREDVIVLTDANAMFETGAVSALVAHFTNPAVGGVCGRLVFHAGCGEVSDEGVYWRWETALKTAESRIDSCLGANGAIYAIRRELFWTEIPTNTIVDDLVIGLKVREQRFHMLYEPGAVANEDLPPDAASEWSRRVRIGAGDFQALTLCWRVLLPTYGAFAWMFFSHKVLRWFTPHLFLIAAAASLARVVCAWQAGGGTPCGGHAGPGLFVGAVPVAVIGIALTLGFVVLAALGRILPAGVGLFSKLVHQGAYFVSMQAALFCGFLRFCRGGLTGHWERTGR